jgi:membrane protein implicated in regulation of membrane protease activity
MKNFLLNAAEGYILVFICAPIMTFVLNIPFMFLFAPFGDPIYGLMAAAVISFGFNGWLAHKWRQRRARESKK